MISHQALDEIEDTANCRFTSSMIEDSIAGVRDAMRILVIELRKNAECDHTHPYIQTLKYVGNHKCPHCTADI